MGYWKNILPKGLFNWLETTRKNTIGKPQLTYSGEGEDLILERLVKHLSKGTYVDIGCYHPKVGSNTYKLFKRGWQGINIDPNPNTIELFNRYRPHDTNLNIGISKDYNVFELTNAIAIRDVHKANVIVDYFSHNPKASSLVPIVSNLFNHFARLMKIHFLGGQSREALATALKVHPFVVGQLTNSAKIYNPKKVAANIAILHEFDLKSKGIGNSTFSEGELMKEMI